LNEARITLKLVLEKAGIEEPTLKSFSERFNIQKKVYLVQLMGLDLGYRFGWYLRGPYSTDLTAEAFTLLEELRANETDHEGQKLAPDATQRVAKATKLWEAPPGLSVSADQWLELLASLHYLKHIAYWPKGAPRGFEEVFASLIATKPQFKDRKADAQQAWDRLEQFGLIAAKTLS
jgi:uncharacterized protein YwgA